VGFDGKPFWFMGALNVYHMEPNELRMELFDPAALPAATKRFAAAADRLNAEGGGVISIYYHPCEWVHEKFWDATNFSRGANPPREQWKAPPQRPAEQTEGAFARFGQYLDFMRQYPNVRFVTIRDLPGIYPDRVRSEGATKAEVMELARRISEAGGKGLDDQTIGAKVFSPAEQFQMLAMATGQLIDGKETYPAPAIQSLLGPDGEPPQPPANARGEIAWPAFRDATVDVCDYLRVHRRIPARVFIGADAVAPADFLVGLALALVSREQTGAFPQTVALGWNVEVLTMRHVAKDRPELFGGWIIHRAGFRAAKLMEIARLQAWTVKPAMRHN
jgi:hypothetical protein